MSIRAPRRAFTLIELLVVVAIIALLISILVPGLNAARNSAKKVATQAQLSTLETGLETFKADNKFGGAYPPSRSDDPDGDSAVISPYTNNEIEITGAGLLVWAMVGADLLGTPGFRDLDDEGWWDNTGRNDPDEDLYYIDNSGEPAYSRADLFVDAKMAMSTNVEDEDGLFLVPEEDGRDPDDARAYPMFLDSFGTPILYYRADPAGRQMVDRSRSEPDTGTERGIYHWHDNAALTEDGSPERVLMDTGDAHQLGFRRMPSGNPRDQVEEIRDADTFADSFTRYILDPTVQARPTPQNRDSFLLISAGVDQIYGTRDDVTNFDPNTD
jgi:prepilin-type N-terminal cleavage/methylation domain-containing protein